MNAVNHTATGVWEGLTREFKRHIIKQEGDWVGHNLSDGETVTTLHGLCLYSFIVKRGLAQRLGRPCGSARSQCLSENMESEAFPVLFMRSYQRRTPRQDTCWYGTELQVNVYTRSAPDSLGQALIYPTSCSRGSPLVSHALRRGLTLAPHVWSICTWAVPLRWTHFWNTEIKL